MVKDMSFKEMYSQKRYKEIINIYLNMSADNIDSIGEFDYLHIVNSFYKEKDFNKCLEIYKVFIKHYPSSSILNNRIGYSMYHVYLKKHRFHDGNKKYIEYVNYITKICKQEKYSPLWFVLKKAIDSILDGKIKPIPDYELANRYLDCINPELLDSNPVKTQKRELASDQEYWYNKKTKILLKLKRYEETIKYCDIALNRIHKFHSNMNIWLMQRKADALYNLDQIDRALDLLNEIKLNGFSHWFINKSLFEIYVKKNNEEKAKMNIALAGTFDKRHEGRILMYEAAAKYLHSVGLSHEALLHSTLSFCIRVENKYNKTITYSIEHMDGYTKDDVLKELLPIWNKWINDNKTFIKGQIIKLLPSEKDGFIRSDNRSFYFSIKDVKNPQSIRVNADVTFTLEDRLNKKKGTVNPCAVEITVG